MIYHILGLVFLIIGCTHLSRRINIIDTSIVRFLQKTYHTRPWLPVFQDIWFFGRTSFTVVMLILFTFITWKSGGIALVVFLIVVGIEQIIKIIFKRSRPYETHQDIRMLQLIKPHDPSFPSGDALRVWYLGLILSYTLGSFSFLFIAVIILAALVSMGRSIMGVHYPSDVIAGTGLGFIGAGTTIWLWNILGV